MKVIFRTFLLVFLLAAPGQVFAETWYEVRSKNFKFYTDNSKMNARTFVKDMEYFRFFLQNFTNIRNTTSPVPLEVFAYKGRTSFNKELDVDDKIGGFFQTHFKGTTAFGMTPRQHQGGGGRELLFHEYVHYFMSQFSRFKYPKWYREGLAEYLSTFTFASGQITIGQANLWSAHLLGSERWNSIDSILGSIADWVPNTNSQNAFGLVYAQAWLIVHYINTKPEYQKALVNYLIELDQGKNYRTAFEETFSMTIEDFEIEVKGYWKKARLPYKIYELSKVEFNPEVSIEKLSESDTAHVKAKAKYYRVRDRDTLEQYEKYVAKVLKKYPDNFKIKLLLYELIYFYGEEREQEGAEKILEIAEAYPTFSEAQSMGGRVLYYRSFDEEDLNLKTKLLQKARDRYQKAIELDSENVFAYFQLGYSYIYQNDQDPNPGFQSIIKSIELLPQFLVYHFDLGLLQARYGLLDEAKDSFEYYLQNGSWKKYRAAAAYCLDEITREGENHQCLFSDYRDFDRFEPEKELTEEDSD